MLKHARAGVPMEVMGLMLGEFVDEYTVRVIDVYSMPQSGNSVTVEAVDPVFQQKMLEMLGQVGRTENCVGWYHSHPGFGCWLSSVDVSTAQSFESSTPQQRAVSVVVDPIQSVTGKVCLGFFQNGRMYVLHPLVLTVCVINSKYMNVFQNVSQFSTIRSSFQHSVPSTCSSL